MQGLLDLSNITTDPTVGTEVPEEPTVGELTEDIALLLLDKLKTTLGSDKTLSTMDLKDASNIFKDVAAYVSKGAGSRSTTSGLEAFLSRLKA